MKDKYIKQLEKAYQRLVRALNGISDNQKVYDSWTKKEILLSIANIKKSSIYKHVMLVRATIGM